MSQEPAAGEPKRGPVQSAVDRFQAWRQARVANRAEAEAIKTPVTQQIRGMSLPQRLERLAQSGNLMSKDAVAQRTGIEKPSDRQIAQESERSEEQQRVERLEKLNRAFADMESPLRMFKTVLVAAVSGPAGILGLAKGLAAFAKGVIASNESLRRFDPAIAASVAQMERQDLILQARTARATGGSASRLNESWMALKGDFQDVHQTVKTGVNYLAVMAANSLRIGLLTVRWTATFQALRRAAEFLEEQERKKLAGESMPAQQFLDDIFNHNWDRPRDFDRNAGNRGDR